MEAILGFLEPFIYPEIIIAILLLTQGVKRYVNLRMHAKWQTLWVALFVITVDLLIRWGDVDFWKAINSFALTTLAYDYIWGFVRDKFWPKEK